MYLSIYLVPISPLARNCILGAYQDLITVDKFENQFEGIYSSLNSTQRGFYIEWLLINLISLGILCQLKIKPIKTIQEGLVLNCLYLVVFYTLKRNLTFFNRV